MLVAVAAFVLLMPARFTAPMRVLFNEATGPIQTAAFQGAGDALATANTVSEMFRGEDRKRALATEVLRLRNEVAALSDKAARQARELRSVSKLELTRLPHRAVLAPLSSYDTSAVRRSILVRAGSRDGVGPGMAAVAYGALVGVVTEAGPRQSRVRLITDADSALPCRPAARQEVHVLEGTGATTCRVDWVDRKGFLEAGEVLVTSARRPDPESRLLVPDGIPVATVVSVEPDALRPLFMAVEAEPRVNLDRLEAVEILVPE